MLYQLSYGGTISEMTIPAIREFHCEAERRIWQPLPAKRNMGIFGLNAGVRC